MNESDIPRTLAVKYARYVDDRQYERMREIMAEDFTQQGPNGLRSSSLEGFISNLAVLNTYQATFHLVGQQYGEWHNDIYTGETWGVASHIYERDGAQRKLDWGIRYQDVIEAHSGSGRYMSRDLHVVWIQDLPCE